MDPNDKGLSRHHIINSVEKSLESLQTNYIDLYYVHAFDRKTPLRETLTTLNDLVRCGKVRHLACCNHVGWQLQKALDMQQYMGLDKYTVLQSQYNLLTRDGEFDAFDVCQEEGVGVIPWDALKSGLLTDRYADRKSVTGQTGTRLEMFKGGPGAGIKNFRDDMTIEELKDNDGFWELMKTLKEVANVHGKTISQISTKWLIKKPQVSSVCIGSKNVQQLEDCMVAGGKWSLSSEEMENIEKASDFARVVPSNFKTAMTTAALRNM